MRLVWIVKTIERVFNKIKISTRVKSPRHEKKYHMGRSKAQTEQPSSHGPRCCRPRTSPKRARSRRARRRIQTNRIASRTARSLRLESRLLHLPPLTLTTTPRRDSTGERGEIERLGPTGRVVAITAPDSNSRLCTSCHLAQVRSCGLPPDSSLILIILETPFR